MAVFISYSWDSNEHIDWVRELAERLTDDGIEVVLDQWELSPGRQLPQFMETAIRENDYVLIICTPAYKEKSDSRTAGAGYEGNIITAELFYKKNYLKFIPIWRSGSWEDAAPTSLFGSYYINLRADNTDYTGEYIKLRNTLRGIPPKTPPKPHEPISFDDDKISTVTEYLLGRAYSGPYGVRYAGAHFINEDDIRDILNQLMRYTRNGNWLTVLYREKIDRIIDSHFWEKGDREYFYDEAERREIMARCARIIKYRLEQYTGEGHIAFNIHPKGDIGFRYL